MNVDYQLKVSAAGRVNIIGEHVDYCGGKVFPAALSLKNIVYVRPNGTNKINIRWTTLPDVVSLDIGRLEDYRNLKYGNYQAGSALMWKNSGHKIIGCDMLQSCTVPFGSGLSSSAAIEVSTIAALAAVAGEDINPVEIALLAQRAERDFVGMNCGIMDQYASACGKKGSAMLLDCKTLACEYVPVNLDGYSLIIANSNKPHSLIESKYNERRAETERALSIVQAHLPISCLADLAEGQLEEFKSYMPSVIYRRAKHVVFECERVNLAVEALKTGDIKELGRLINESHKSLKDLYEVTGAELDCLAEAAQKHCGCVGSRMTGGGFGGSTVSIVKNGFEESFIDEVGGLYSAATGYKADFYTAEISDGITVEKLYL